MYNELNMYVQSRRRRKRYVRLDSPFNPNTLHEIICGSNTSCVRHNDWHTIEIQGEVEDVARCARDRGDDCCLALGFRERRISSNCKRGMDVDKPKKLSKLLLPALGGPKMASLTPDRTISPRRWSFRWDSIVANNFSARSLTEIQDAISSRAITSAEGVTLLIYAFLDIFAFAKVDECLKESETAKGFGA
jgi:hypothetical protein